MSNTGPLGCVGATLGGVGCGLDSCALLSSTSRKLLVQAMVVKQHELDYAGVARLWRRTQALPMTADVHSVKAGCLGHLHLQALTDERPTPLSADFIQERGLVLAGGLAKGSVFVCDDKRNAVMCLSLVRHMDGCSVTGCTDRHSLAIQQAMKGRSAVPHLPICSSLPKLTNPAGCSAGFAAASFRLASSSSSNFSCTDRANRL